MDIDFIDEDVLEQERIHRESERKLHRINTLKVSNNIRTILSLHRTIHKPIACPQEDMPGIPTFMTYVSYPLPESVPRGNKTLYKKILNYLYTCIYNN